MLSSHAELTLTPSDSAPVDDLGPLPNSGDETSSASLLTKIDLDIDSALQEFEPLASPHGYNAEAQQQLVDRILQLLGWSATEIRPEPASRSRDYTDYVLGRQHPFVVEAKRHSATFHLPEKYSKRRYKLSTLATKGGEALSTLIDRATSYCQEVGAPYAVVTNGYQWILFRGVFYLGSKAKSRAAVVFNGLTDLRENFLELEQYLGKSREDDSALEQEFEEPMAVPAYSAKPSSDISQRPSTRREKKGVALLFDQYFDEIARADDPEMLERCFVEDASLRDYDKSLRDLLEDRPSGGPRNRAKVALVVGRTGAGKTTFLARLMRRLEKAERLSLLVDLNLQAEIAPEDTDAKSEKLARQILEQLADDLAAQANPKSELDPFTHSTLRAIFDKDIERLKNGPYANVFALDGRRFEEAVASLLSDLSSQAQITLTAFLRHISRTKGKPFCLVFDGLERAPDDEQRFVYLFAHRLAAKIDGVIVLALRNSAYFRAKSHGAPDTQAKDLVLRVEPPNLKDVLSQRLEHFRHHVRLENKFYASLGSGKASGSEIARAPKKMQSHLAGMAPSVSHLSDLILGADTEALEMIAGLGNRSIRQSFDLLRSYASSVHAWKPATDLSVRSQVLQCLMLQNQQLYSENSSPNPNLFQVPKDRQASHFSSLAVLCLLKWHHENREGSDDELSLRDLSRELLGWRLAPSTLWLIVAKLASRNLLEVHNGSLLKLRPAGFYLLRELAGHDLYHLHCAYETRWYDEGSAAAFISSLRVAIRPDAVAADKALRDSDCLKLWREYLSRKYALDSKKWSAVPRPWHKELKAFALRAKLSFPESPATLARASRRATMQLDLEFD